MRIKTETLQQLALAFSIGAAVLLFTIITRAICA